MAFANFKDRVPAAWYGGGSVCELTETVGVTIKAPIRGADTLLHRFVFSIASAEMLANSILDGIAAHRERINRQRESWVGMPSSSRSSPVEIDGPSPLARDSAAASGEE
jgi:hypothetical protein